MNHRRKRNPRREGKRISRKKLRRATDAAMNGQTPGTVALPWSQGGLNSEVPVVNDAPRHRKMTQKKAHKKEKCLGGGSHTWERSVSETKDDFRRQITGPCARCESLHRDWKRDQERWKRLGYNEWLRPTSGYERSMLGWCHWHGEKVVYTIKTLRATCTKCGTSKIIDRDSDAYDLRWPKTKRNTIPKRTVTLY